MGGMADHTKDFRSGLVATGELTESEWKAAFQHSIRGRCR